MNQGRRLAGALGMAMTLAACSQSATVTGKFLPTDGGVSPARCGDAAQRPWCDSSLSPQARTDLLLAAMTLQQKLGLMAGDDILGVVNSTPATGTVDGIPELGIPNIYFSDGPMGTREGSATAMPSPLALGASFNPELAGVVGKTVSNEVRLKGNDIVHAPTVDIVRTGLAGRTFETYGEDPWLSSRLAVAWIKGSQSEGVIGNVKHFLLNSQEGQIGVPPLTAVVGSRQTVNAVADERTLREIYLQPFEAAVKEGGVGAVMCSYNFVNGSPACSNKHLLQEVLRDDWGFDGFVVSDYVLAVKDTLQSANNGTEIEMPVAVFYTPALLQLAVIGGLVPEDVIDTRVGNILRTLFKFGFFDRADFPTDDSLIDQPAHALVARTVEEQGMVLLQNNGVLPLDASALHSIAVIGVPANTYHNVGGSAAVTPFHYTAPVDAITQRVGSGVRVDFADGSDADAAAALAKNADVAIVYVKDDAKEGVDKTCLAIDCPAIPFLPIYPTPQQDLIEAVTAANAHTIVMLEVGGPIVTPWRSQTAAVVATWYPGQNAGDAQARVLFGDTDPGGRLPLTFPEAENQTPTAGNLLQYPGLAQQAVYSEGVMMGYRWYDQNAVAPAFPFGFGLSYTTFGASGLQLSKDSDGKIHAAWDVRNTGTRAGWAVAQLYAGLPAPAADVEQPPNALKGFQKVWLEKGESRRVDLVVDDRALSYWSESASGWQVADGCYALRAGFSSRELPLQAALKRAGSVWTIGGC